MKKIPRSKSDIRKILFVTLSNIGDVILTLPVLSGLKDVFPDADIDVVVGPRPQGIFKKDPRVRNIFTYDKKARLEKKISFIRKLRSERYDLAVDMRTSLIPLLIGARYASSLIAAQKSKDRHKKSIHLNKLEELGIVGYRLRSAVYIDAGDRKKINALLKEHGCDENDALIGISPSTRGILKQWHADGFIEVIRGLLKKGKYRIVLIGDAGQLGLSGEISGPINSGAVIDLTGRVNLNELFALIERMQLLLTCDSAALHIASDLGVKTVALFGPTDPGEYGPVGNSAIVIRKDIKCSPCKKAVCAFNRECMKEIKPEEVLTAIEQLSRV